ncbi:MAG: DEAD/DEAH box helicase [Methanosphaera stadtmanae]|nr:DEAD/DEAH box helicase [Methanosphaera stadtmanae]
MSFRNIDNSIKSTYKSTNEDLVEDFYNIVLSHSTYYDRITGYFNSTSLAIAASGILNFIKNNGKMRLLCGTSFNEEDLNAIKNSNELKDFINKKFLIDLENIKNEIIDNHVKLLGWMVANELLEIKIGVKKTKNGYSNSGILHSKIGIMYDDEGQIITFDGSVNETAGGWKNNIESLKVFKSWKDYKFMVEDLTDFENYWEGKNDKLEVFEIPEASKKQLIKKAPEKFDDLDKLILKKIKTDTKKEQRILFQHQKDAINFWFNNSKIGIFEMATGTGKTFTALKSMEKLVNEEDVLTIIATPQAHISLQWEKDFKEMGIGKSYLIFSSANKKWYNDLKKLIIRINYNIPFNKPNVIFTTHSTFANEKFINEIKKANIKKLCIIDEMHHIGSENQRNGLLDEYNYRLGLSATPSRFMDYEGTELLLSYFNNNIFKFNIFDALNTINPITNEPFLTPYEYFPYNVHLTKDEIEDYSYLTQLIGMYMNSKKEEDHIKADKFKRQRQNIINNAKNKFSIFINILNEIEDKEHLIVFCSPQQLNKVLKILSANGFSPRHRLTQKENATPSKKYNGLSEREVILNEFDKGNYKALVGIKCINEGVDVPSADKVIIMSSTTNPIEYIQRRGRVLRRHPSKKIAKIYDLTVLPSNKEEKFNRLIKNEIKRLYDFISNASNKYDCIKKLEKWGVYD